MKALLGLFLVSSFASAMTVPLSAHRFRGACETGVSAFTETVHKKVMKDCKECHGGTTNLPAFAVPDVEQSYFRVRNFVNFGSPNASKLVNQAGNGHCFGKPNCNSTSGEEMLALVKEWWEKGQKECKDFGAYYSLENPLPPEVVKGDPTFVTLEWDLGKIAPAFAKNFFQLEVKRFAAPTAVTPGAYIFRKPRIRGAIEGLHIKGIKILVNRKYDVVANAYNFIDKTVGSLEEGETAHLFSAFSSDTLIVLQDLAENDMLSISFDVIEKAEAEPCKAEGEFTDHILPHFETFKCYDCHGGGPTKAAGTAPANVSFSLARTGATLCRSVREHLNLWEMAPYQSSLVTLPVGGKLDHKVVVDKPAAFIADLEKWFDLEKPSRR